MTCPRVCWFAMHAQEWRLPHFVSTQTLSSKLHRKRKRDRGVASWDFSSLLVPLGRLVGSASLR